MDEAVPVDGNADVAGRAATGVEEHEVTRLEPIPPDRSPDPPLLGDRPRQGHALLPEDVPDET